MEEEDLKKIEETMQAREITEDDLEMESSGFLPTPKSDLEVAIDTNFPTTEKSRTKKATELLKMVADLTGRMVPIAAVNSVISRRIMNKERDKHVLEMFLEEIYIHRISLDRKGRLELSEILVSKLQDSGRELGGGGYGGE